MHIIEHKDKCHTDPKIQRKTLEQQEIIALYGAHPLEDTKLLSGANCENCG